MIPPEEEHHPDLEWRLVRKRSWNDWWLYLGLTALFLFIAGWFTLGVIKKSPKAQRAVKKFLNGDSENAKRKKAKPKKTRRR